MVEKKKPRRKEKHDLLVIGLDLNEKRERENLFFIPPKFSQMYQHSSSPSLREKTSVSVFKSPNYGIGHTKDHKMC